MSPVYLYHQAFNSCLNIGSTAAYGKIGKRLIDKDNNSSHTMTLTRS